MKRWKRSGGKQSRFHRRRNRTQQRRPEKNTGAHFADDRSLAGTPKEPADAPAGGDDDEQLKEKDSQWLRPRGGPHYTSGVTGTKGSAATDAGMPAISTAVPGSTKSRCT